MEDKVPCVVYDGVREEVPRILAEVETHIQHYRRNASE